MKLKQLVFIIWKNKFFYKHFDIEINYNVHGKFKAKEKFTVFEENKLKIMAIYN